MKKLSFLAAAALVALGTSAATAQDTTRKESKGDVRAPVTAASIVTVVDASAATAVKIGMLKPATPPNVEFVDAKTFAMAEADQTLIKAAVEKNQDAIKQLQDELKKHDALVQAISNSDQKPEVGDVIGAEVQEGDKLVIYFWKK